MFRRHYNLILMGLWIAVGACMLAPELVLPDKILNRIRVPGGMLAGLLSFTFAAYNFVRWWSYQSIHARELSPNANPLAERRFEGDQADYVPNPELDFYKSTELEKPGPSAKDEFHG